MRKRKLGIKRHIMILSALMVCTLFVSYPTVSVAQYCQSVPKDNVRTTEGWSEDVRLTICTRARYPAIGVNGDFIHVVWQGPRGDVENPWSYELYYNRSVDGGKTWEKGKMLSLGENNTLSGPAAIAVNGNNIHIAYENDRNAGIIEIYYVNSTDNGETWSEPNCISANDGIDSQWPDIAVWGDNIYVVWGDGTVNPELRIRNSTDGGKTWNSIQPLTADDGVTSCNSKIAVNDTNLHVVWIDYRDGNWETYYKKSINKGGSWSTDIPISSIDGFNSDGAEIAVSDSNIHVVWQDNMDYSHDEIHYRNSTTNGDIWNSETNITTDDGYDSCFPRIQVNGYNIHLVWADETDSAGAGSEIYYCNSTDGGIVWNSMVRLTDAPNYSGGAKIAIYRNFIHVVWVDNRVGGTTTDYDIYYKRYPKFNDPPVINDFYPQENLTITENQNITFMINATDPENDTLSYQWYLNNVSVGENGSTYMFTANSTCSGTFEIKVIVSNNVSSPINHSWTLIVINVGELYNDIADLQDLISQLNLIVSELNETINNLNQSLTLIWSELNQSVQNYSDLENQTLSLINTLSGIWELLNLSKQNETVLQSYIGNLTENLTSANNLIAELWDILNLSKQNETSLLNQIDELEQENTNLRNKLNETKTETPWVGVIETIILLVGLCVIVLAYSRKKRGRKYEK